MESDEHRAHLGLHGRPDTVFPMKTEMSSRLSSKHPHHNNTDKLATKLHWPDDSRQSEPDILNAVHEIAQRKSQVDGHVPEIEMIWLHQVEETSTAKLRRELEIDDPERCSRMLNIHVSWKHQPMTKLSGKEFKRAWWEVISGVHHYDVSPSNLMVYQTPSGLVMCVINDCDLSESSSENGSDGHERIGMIPFMAMDLLTKEAIEGRAEHLYQHIAESFMWAFMWVCLQYEDGKPLSKDRPLDCWLAGDAISCQKIKCSLLTSVMENRVQVSPPHQPLNWSRLACVVELSLLNLIASYCVKDPTVLVGRWTRIYVSDVVQCAATIVNAVYHLLIGFEIDIPLTPTSFDCTHHPPGTTMTL
ncbi:hypothetical protein EDB19DRAFT_1912084 [Suillus lakei]|nr:hypothetical protein EDB19DRAFT_1912084 [Suillus lakei]